MGDFVLKTPGVKGEFFSLRGSKIKKSDDVIYGLILRTVENAVADRDYLTWRPPKGESVVDLRNRIKEFLQEIQKEALKLPSDSPVILISSHGLFMDELYYVTSTSGYGQTLPKVRFS